MNTDIINIKILIIPNVLLYKHNFSISNIYLNRFISYYHRKNKFVVSKWLLLLFFFNYNGIINFISLVISSSSFYVKIIKKKTEKINY